MGNIASGILLSIVLTLLAQIGVWFVERIFWALFFRGMTQAALPGNKDRKKSPAQHAGLLYRNLSVLYLCPVVSAGAGLGFSFTEIEVEALASS